MEEGTFGLEMEIFFPVSAREFLLQIGFDRGFFFFSTCLYFRRQEPERQMEFPGLRREG